jgi:hypothetical protein
MEKYFVIGFNKTATKTFHNLFLQNNLTSHHNGKQVLNKPLKYNTKWPNIDSYECFSDNGNFQDYRLLDTKYPNSIFILNLRRLDEWLISRFKHGLRGDYEPARLCTKEKCKKWIYNREEFYKKILDYFKDKPDKLIIVSIDKENWISYISSELNFKNTNIESQHVFPTNESAEHKNIIDIVNNTFNQLSYSLDDRKNILFKDISLTEKYLKIFRNNLS